MAHDVGLGATSKSPEGCFTRVNGDVMKRAEQYTTDFKSEGVIFNIFRQQLYSLPYPVSSMTMIITLPSGKEMCIDCTVMGYALHKILEGFKSGDTIRVAGKLSARVDQQIRGPGSFGRVLMVKDIAQP